MFCELGEKSINFILNSNAIIQRWSPQGRPWPREPILKSLALKPTSPRKCPVFGRGQHYFLVCKKWANVMTFFFLVLDTAPETLQ